jgi:hypothetical protein
LQLTQNSGRGGGGADPVHEDGGHAVHVRNV